MRTYNDTWLNTRQMAESLGISTTAFNKWKVTPEHKAKNATYYSVRGVVENRVEAALRNQLSGVGQPARTVGEDGEVIDPVAEKALLDRERRKGQEISNSQKLGEVFPTVIAEMVFGRIGAEIAAVLETLPGKLKTMRPDFTGAELAEINREIARARNAAASVGEAFDDILEEYYAEAET